MDQLGFPDGSDSKESACSVGDLVSIPGLGRSPGGGHGNPLQYSCLENPMDRGVWRATVHGVAKSRTRLSDFTSLLHTVSMQQMLAFLIINSNNPKIQPEYLQIICIQLLTSLLKRC